MVGDTAITGGTIDLREREFMLKIEPAEGFPALIGFAGGAEHGAQIARTAVAAGTPEETLKILIGGRTTAAQSSLTRYSRRERQNCTASPRAKRPTA